MINLTLIRVDQKIKKKHYVYKSKALTKAHQINFFLEQFIINNRLKDPLIQYSALLPNS